MDKHCVTLNVSILDALRVINDSAIAVAVVCEGSSVKGILTDGDLRRMLEHNYDIHRTSITEVMTKHCKVIDENLLAAEAMHIMEEFKINALIVVDQQQRPVGSLNMHDLIRAGIV